MLEEGASVEDEPSLSGTSVGFQSVSTGVFIGAGMQKVVALSNLVSYYVIGLPVGIALMFAAKLRILGNVFAQTNLCLFVQGLCYMIT